MSLACSPRMTSSCHHLPMNRTDRLYALREELRRAGPEGRTAEQLAARFEVSARTVKRDVSALQQGGFPVWARIGRIGGYVVDRNATLPPVNITAAEATALAAALGLRSSGNGSGSTTRTIHRPRNGPREE
jgi:predicted DNA-binding transcriptional regulator YafY